VKVEAAAKTLTVSTARVSRTQLNNFQKTERNDKFRLITYKIDSCVRLCTVVYSVDTARQSWDSLTVVGCLDLFRMNKALTEISWCGLCYASETFSALCSMTVHVACCTQRRHERHESGRRVAFKCWEQ
jgi:hypothetical protein